MRSDKNGDIFGKPVALKTALGARPHAAWRRPDL
jgi:hypothetical protein